MKSAVPRQKCVANGRLGFTLIEIMVTILLIAILSAVAVPTFLQSRATSRRTACLENLRQLDQAKEQFGMAKGLQNGSSVNWSDVVPTYVKQTPRCPTGGDYTLNPIGVDPTCSLALMGHHQ